MPETIDFAAIKETVSIEAAARFLGLKLVQHQDTFRCACPVCKRGGERAIIITPAKKAFYCHGTCRTGGDAIKLVAHVRGIKQVEAAKLLMEHFMREPVKSKRPAQRKRANSKEKGSKLSPSTDDYSLVDHLNQFGG